jgi:hypothetical protein
MEAASDADWSSGSGTLGVWHRDRVLIISKKPGLGYMVSFLAGQQSAPGDVIVRHDDFAQVTTVLVGGDPWSVPEAFFVDEDVARAAIDHFFVTGEKAPALAWTDAGRAMTAAGL